LTALRGGELRVQVLRPNNRGMMEEVALRVRVPPGVQDGAVIRLRGQAGTGRMGAQAGDVLLTLRVSGEGHLRKHGQDLLLDVPVTIGEALLGGRISVPTPFGVLQVAIPAGSGEGTTLRVRGRGLGGPEGRRSGDLVLVLRPQVPDLLTEETLELARRMERLYTRNVRSDMEF
jgi:DnaJ-class molecular chaperone